MTTSDVFTYLKTIFPAYATKMKNGFVDRAADECIGIMHAPSFRTKPLICIGGLDNTPTQMLPINILVRWGKDSAAFDVVTNTILSTLLSLGNNIQISEDKRVVEFTLLDGIAVGVGRDIENVCEGIIRVNIEYYI